MEIRQMFLPEFDQEIKNTRAMLERVPEGKPDFKPHQKSMALSKLAAHTAQLPEFAVRIVELPELDFSKSDMKPLVMESRQLGFLAAFDAIAAKARAAIEKASDEQWQQKWKLSFQGHTIIDQPRFLVYRSMFPEPSHSSSRAVGSGICGSNDVPLPGYLWAFGGRQYGILENFHIALA